MMEGVVIDNSGLFNEKLQHWENFYNFQRPHGSFAGRTPFEKLQGKLKELSLTGILCDVISLLQTYRIFITK
jgi:hypothetical protein